MENKNQNKHIITRKNTLALTGIIALSALGFFLMNSVTQQQSFSERTQSAAVILGEEYAKFTHPEHNFSIEHPKDLRVERFEEELPEGVKGETILFQHKDDAPEDRIEEKMGFQIFIVPFKTEVGKETKLTRERILKDVPTAEVEDALPVIINPDAPKESRIEGLLFWSTDGRGNRTRELWFIHEGNLYEITTYAHLDTWLAKLLSTWR